MFYLITGENKPIIDDEIEKIQTEFKDIPFEKLSSVTDFEYFIQNTESCDMFTPLKGQILADPLWIKKITKPQLEQLRQCFTLAQSFKLPIIIICKKIDKRSAIYKLLKTFGFYEKDCPLFKEWETQKIINWISNYCKKRNSNISTHAAQILVDAYGTNAGIIKQEIEKCLVSILPKTTISNEDLITASSNALGEYGQLATAIKQGAIDDMIKTMDQLLKLKEDPHKILNQTLFQLNQLFPISLALRQNISAENCAKQLGKHPFFVKKQMESLKRNSLKSKFHKIIINLSVLDKKIKTGKLSSKTAIFSFSNHLKYQI